MKNGFSKRNFVYCSLEKTDVPVEKNEGCCEFYNVHTGKCEYSKYSRNIRKKRLSEREENYKAFSHFTSRDENFYDE